MIHGLAILIFLRPYICSLIQPGRSLLYTTILFGFLIIWMGSRRTSLPEKSILTATAVFTGILAISAFISGSHLSAAMNLSQYMSGILLFMLCRALPHDHAKRIFNVIITAGITISLIGLYQFFFGFQDTLEFLRSLKTNDLLITQEIQQKRIYAVFITPNILGCYLAMLLPLTLTLRNKIWVLPLAFALLLTQSVGTFMTLLFMFPFYAYQRRLYNPAIFGIFAVIIFTGAGFIFWRTQPHTVIFNLGHSIDMRWQYWKETWTLIKTHPLIGTGIGNFDIPSVRYSHNIILQLWAETGLAGLLSFLYLLYAILRHGWVSLKTATDPDRSTALLFSAMIFLVNNLIDFSFFLPEVALIWCVILGLACNRVARTDACATPAENNPVPTKRS